MSNEISIVALLSILIALLGLVISVLSHLNQRKQMLTQKTESDAKHREHELAQKEQVSKEFNQVQASLAQQKADGDKNNSLITQRLDQIEKEVTGFKEVHTEIAVIKNQNAHIIQLMDEMREQIKIYQKPAPVLRTRRKS